jgi:hypothetical protein
MTTRRELAWPKDHPAQDHRARARWSHQRTQTPAPQDQGDHRASDVPGHAIVARKSIAGLFNNRLP